MVDLDVTVRVVRAVGRVEVKGAHRAGGSVLLDGQPAVLLASLVGGVEGQTLAPFAVGDYLLVDVAVGDVVYLQGLLGDLLAPIGSGQQPARQPLTFVLEDLLDEILDAPEVFLYLRALRVRDPGEAPVGAVEVALELVEGLVDLDGL